MAEIGISHNNFAESHIMQNNLAYYVDFLHFYAQIKPLIEKKLSFKNYWNYCDSEKTIADTIDIATFLSI